MPTFAGKCAKLRHFEDKNAYKTLTQLGSRFLKRQRCRVMEPKSVHISSRLRWKMDAGSEERQPIPPDCGQQPRAKLEKLLTLLQSDPIRFPPIAPGGSIVGHAKVQANPASKSSGASSRRFRSPRALAFMAESSPMGMRIGDCFPAPIQRGIDLY
jgi:hypothetical protein